MSDDAWVVRESVLEHVELFRRGAEVTRRLTLEADDRLLRVAPLPLELDDGSVRVELATGTRASVKSVRLALDVRDAPDDPLHLEPEPIRDARRRLRAIALELEELRARHARAGHLSIPERPARDAGRPPPPAPDRARLELLELRFALQREARERSQALEHEKHELERALRTLLEAHAKRSTDSPLQHRVQKAIELELDHASAGALRLIYRVRSARWAPSYRLAFETRSQRARVAMRAVIAQRTGEDWRGATLAVSTARMDGWYDLPELAALRIGRAQPPPRTGYRALPQDGAALFADYDRLVREPAPPPPPRHAAPAVQPIPTPSAAPWQGSADLGELAASTTRAGSVDGRLSKAEAAPAVRAPAPRQAPPAKPALNAPAAAMPAPGAPPPMMPMMVQTAAPQAKGGGGLMANLLGGFGAGGAPSASYGALDEQDLTPSHGGARRHAAIAAEVPGPVSPARALLDFGSLRLAAASDSARGVLRAVDLESRAREAGHADAMIVQAMLAMRANESTFTQVAAPALHTYPDSLFGFDYRYAASGRIEVPSDGAFHTVAITEAEGPASLLHVSVPREDPAVFRTLDLTSPLEGAVLRGPVDLYLDGSLLVSGSLSPTPTRGKLEVGMGVDESVKVARNVRYREESAGLMGGSSHLVHEIEIDVRNASASPIRLEVRERLPVLAKGEEEIELRLGKTSPPWQDHAQDDPPLEGGKRWIVEVGAGAETTLRTEYTIRISAKNELVGGNRRD
ncbi:MAG: DUF4139 domain-containing protein [Sandaracinus sp.]